MDGGEHLCGIDKRKRHDEIRDRAKGYCEVCGDYCPNNFGEPQGGEWDHHPISGLGKPDNVENGRWICASCHRTGPEAKHVRTHLKSIPGIPNNSRSEYDD